MLFYTTTNSSTEELVATVQGPEFKEKDRGKGDEALIKASSI